MALSDVSVVRRALVTDSNDDLAAVEVAWANESIEDLEAEVRVIGF